MLRFVAKQEKPDKFKRLFYESSIRTRSFQQTRDEEGKFKRKCGCVTHRNEEKFVIRKISSTIKQQRNYKELVKKNLLSSRATYDMCVPIVYLLKR